MERSGGNTNEIRDGSTSVTSNKSGNADKSYSGIQWKQRYYFYFHLAFFVLVSLFGGLMIFIIEIPYNTSITFVDALFTSTSSLCITGLLTVDFSKFSLASQIIVLVLIYFGGLTVTTLPSLMIHIFIARRQMLEKYKEVLEGENNQHALMEHQLMKTPILPRNKSLRGDDDNDDEKNGGDGGGYGTNDQQHLELNDIYGESENKKSNHNQTVGIEKSIQEGEITSIDDIPFLNEKTDIDANRIEDNLFLKVDIPIHNEEKNLGHVDYIVVIINDENDELQVHLDSAHNESMTNSPTLTVSQSAPLGFTSIDIASNFLSIGDEKLRFIQDENPQKKESIDSDSRPSFDETMPTGLVRRKAVDAGREIMALTDYQKSHIETILKTRPPPPAEAKYYSLILLSILTFCLSSFIYLSCFLILGLYFQIFYDKLSTDGRHSLDNNNPWWTGLFLTISAFNNAGITVFNDSLTRFANDIFVNFMISFLIIAGNTGFPFLLRTIISILYSMCNNKTKLLFKYLLNHHHHLSIHLFPALETRVYIVTSVILLCMGLIVGLVLEFQRAVLEHLSYGSRILAMIFQSVSTRTAGFNTIDIGALSLGTILVYILMMRIKPQMFCSLDEKAYNIINVEKELIEKDELSKKNLKLNNRKLGKNIVKIQMTKKNIESVLGDEFQSYGNVSEEELKAEVLTPLQKIQLWTLSFYRKVWHHTANILLRNNYWIMIIVFGLVISQHEQMNTDYENYSFVKILFEVISAFGNVGISMGFPGKVTSFSGILTPFSKFLIMITMLLGRHRGLLNSLKDQEKT